MTPASSRASTRASFDEWATESNVSPRVQLHILHEAVACIAEERDALRDALVRAARLCEGRDTAMVLQVLREALDA